MGLFLHYYHYLLGMGVGGGGGCLFCVIFLLYNILLEAVQKLVTNLYII